MPFRRMIERLDARRLLAVIAPDVTWGDDGFVSRTMEGEYVGRSATGGSIVSTVDFALPDGADLSIRRYTAAGRPDPDFTTIVGSRQDTPAADRSGRPLVLIADDAGGFSVHRYTTAGRVDTSFGTAGAADFVPAGASDTGRGGSVEAVTTGEDGSVFVLTAVSNASGKTDVCVTKLTRRGKLDASFGTGGTLTLPGDFGPISFPRNWLGIDSQGRLLVAASGYGTFDLRRFGPTGLADRAFGEHGRITGLNVVGGGGVALDAQDRLLIADQFGTLGYEDAGARLLRYDARGRLDRAFGHDGAVLADDPTPNNGFGNQRVLALPDGTIAAELGREIIRVDDHGAIVPGGQFELPNAYVEIADSDQNGVLLANVSTGVPYEYDNVARLVAEPAVAVGPSGTLYLNGSGADDNFQLARSGTADLTVTFDGRTQNVGPNVKAIRAELHGGNDVFVDRYFPDDADIPTTVNGEDGRDSIVTGAGDDIINGGTGNDTIRAGDGYDQIIVGRGRNVADGGAGGANIRTGNIYDDYNDYFDNTITGSGGPDDLYRFQCSTGHPVVSFTGGAMRVDVLGAASAIVTLRNAGPAAVLGTDGRDSIITGDGDDYVLPGENRDTVRTGGGNDTVYGENRDRAGGRPAPHVEDDYYDLGAGDDVAIDGYGNNVIVGGDGRDSIVTGDGNDSIDAGLGRDTVRSNGGADTIDGGGSGDRLFGGADNDSIVGGGGPDLLVGGAGDDTLIGNAGDDVLIAGYPNAARVDTARNLLDGGGGNDQAQRESDDDTLTGIESELDHV